MGTHCETVSVSARSTCQKPKAVSVAWGDLTEGCHEQREQGALVQGDGGHPAGGSAFLERYELVVAQRNLVVRILAKYRMLVEGAVSHLRTLMLPPFFGLFGRPTIRGCMIPQLIHGVVPKGFCLEWQTCFFSRWNREHGG